MRDQGFELDWGVGGHGSGNNVFPYFVGPNEFVIEYATEGEKVDRPIVFAVARIGLCLWNGTSSGELTSVRPNG